MAEFLVNAILLMLAVLCAVALAVCIHNLIQEAKEDKEWRDRWRR